MAMELASLHSTATEVGSPLSWPSQSLHLYALRQRSRTAMVRTKCKHDRGGAFVHKRIVAIVVAALMTVGLLAVPAEPAEAHASTYPWAAGCGPIGGAQCGHSEVTSTHRIVRACDDYADGDGFATAYELSNGSSGTVVDPNGSASGCGGYITPAGVFVERFRPCRRGTWSGCLILWRDA